MLHILKKKKYVIVATDTYLLLLVLMISFYLNFQFRRRKYFLL